MIAALENSAGIKPGRGTLLTAVLGVGRTLAARGGPEWKHPWTVTPGFIHGRWSATVKAGFVNGECPVVRTTTKEQKELGGGFRRDLSRVINARSGRGEIARAAALSSGGGTRGSGDENAQLDIPLYLNPALKLSFHEAKAIPAFFAARGAANAQPASENADGETVAAVPAPAGSRRLLACDVWIHQPRLALTSDISLHPGPVTGISNVTQTLGLRGATPGDALRVQSGLLRETAGIDPLAGVYEEPNYDEQLIATVFVLSPPDTDPASEPDGSWQPFVRHELFWNLDYATPWFRQYGGDPSIPFLPPLAGGAATLVTNWLVASINDITQAALNLVTSHSMSGTFYTPTGGGHSAKMPGVSAVSRGVTGLDRAGRDAAAAAIKRRAAAQPLDPPYPYRAQSFDSALLTQTT